jgi:hypothetical protein
LHFFVGTTAYGENVVHDHTTCPPSNGVSSCPLSYTASFNPGTYWWGVSHEFPAGDIHTSDALPFTVVAPQPPPAQPQPPPAQPQPPPAQPQPPPAQPQPPPAQPQPPPAQPPGTDGDRDGVRGTADKCPRQNRGRFDFNRNGCPGPFRQIRPKLTWGRIEINVDGPGVVRLTALGISKLPRGGLVTLQAAHTNESVKVPRSGSVRLTRIGRAKLRDGVMVRVRIASRGWIGYEAALRVSDKGRPQLIRELCVAATGAGAAVPCGDVDRGK